MELCWQMPKFIVWHLWSIYFDHHLPLKPSIRKRRKQSCTPNSTRGNEPVTRDATVAEILEYILGQQHDICFYRYKSLYSPSVWMENRCHTLTACALRYRVRYRVTSSVKELWYPLKKNHAMIVRFSPTFRRSQCTRTEIHLFASRSKSSALR